MVLSKPKRKGYIYSLHIFPHPLPHALNFTPNPLSTPSPSPSHFRVLHGVSLLRFPVGFIVVFDLLILVFIFVVVSSSAEHGF